MEMFFYQAHLFTAPEIDWKRNGLDRCINAVMVANEWVRAERKEMQRQASDPGSRSMRGDGSQVQSAESPADVEISIKASMKTFLQCAVATVLEPWDDAHRSDFALVFWFLLKTLLNIYYKALHIHANLASLSILL